MTKKIIGYQLTKPEFEKAAIQIINDPGRAADWNIELEQSGYPKSIPVDCNAVEALNKAGVLKLWFTPIYQKGRSTLKANNWLYILNPEGYGGHTGDVVRIIHISNEDENSIWINHTPSSFSGGGFRCNDTVFPFGKAFRLASNEEVAEYLIQEAKIKYSAGVTVDQKSAYGGSGNICTISDGHVRAELHGNIQEKGYINITVGGVGVYNTQFNVWAEIKPAPKITINGFEAVFEGDCVKFGCQTLRLDFVEQIRELAAYNVTLVDKDGESLTDAVTDIYYHLSKLSIK